MNLYKCLKEDKGKAVKEARQKKVFQGLKGMVFHCGKESTKQWVSRTFYKKMKKRRKLMWRPKERRDREEQQESGSEIAEKGLHEAAKEVSISFNKGDEREEDKGLEEVSLEEGELVASVIVPSIEEVNVSSSIIKDGSKTTDDVCEEKEDVEIDRGHFSEGHVHQDRELCSKELLRQQCEALDKKIRGKFWENIEIGEEEESLLSDEQEAEIERKASSKSRGKIRRYASDYLLSEEERKKKDEESNNLSKSVNAGGRRFTRSILKSKFISTQ